METEITTTQNEASEEIVMADKIERCRFLGKNLDILFKLKIASIAVAISLVILALFTRSIVGGIGSTTSIGFMYLILAVLVILALGALGISIAMIVIMFRMGKYDDDFKYAGIFVLVSSLIQAGGNIAGSDVVKIIASVFSVLYIFKFTKAMTAALNSVNDDIAKGWGNLKNLYVYALIGMGACFILIFIPLIGSLASFVLFLCAIAFLVAGIWEISLIYESAKALNSYPDTGTQTVAE